MSVLDTVTYGLALASIVICVHVKRNVELDLKLLPWDKRALKVAAVLAVISVFLLLRAPLMDAVNWLANFM
jgi:hypothetical protein